MTEKKPGIRLQLWLRKDGRKYSPEYFIKDVANLDDPYQKDRFMGRTFSENDKFVEGVFLTEAELEAIEAAAIGNEILRRDKELEEAFNSGRDINCCGTYPGCGSTPYATFNDYKKQRGE